MCLPHKKQLLINNFPVLSQFSNISLPFVLQVWAYEAPSAIGVLIDDVLASVTSFSSELGPMAVSQQYGQHVCISFCRFGRPLSLDQNVVHCTDRTEMRF